jgi:hypothetical protein
VKLPHETNANFVTARIVLAFNYCQDRPERLLEKGEEISPAISTSGHDLLSCPDSNTSE